MWILSTCPPRGQDPAGMNGKVRAMPRYSGIVARPGYHLIFRPVIRLRNGRVLYAQSYGLAAFPIWVRD